jgi:hypothetical protein
VTGRWTTVDDLAHLVRDDPAQTYALCRIVHKRYATTPMALSKNATRFSDPASRFEVGYFARQEECALNEVLVRDFFKHDKPKVIERKTLEHRLFVYVEQSAALRTLDITGGRLNTIDISDDVRHSKDHAESQKLAWIAYYALEVDAIAYLSYYHGGLCMAIFDRSITKFRYTGKCTLDENVNTRPILRKLGIDVV